MATSRIISRPTLQRYASALGTHSIAAMVLQDYDEAKRQKRKVKIVMTNNSFRLDETKA